jgi:hypothetical protein
MGRLATSPISVLLAKLGKRVGLIKVNEGLEFLLEFRQVYILCLTLLPGAESNNKREVSVLLRLKA